MLSLSKHKRIKLILILLLSLNDSIFPNGKIFLKMINGMSLFNSTTYLKIKPFSKLFNDTNKNSTILIFEPNTYHHECTPGFSKYFLELGYNVDILINLIGIDSFSLFQDIEKISLYTFNNLSEIMENSKILSSVIKKYDFVLLQTTDKNKKNIYANLDLLNINTSIFVFHDVRYINYGYLDYLNQSRVWTLGNFPIGLRINPHYFGNIKLKDKGDKTIFFMTSTPRRNYNYLVESVKRLKQENYNFEIIITGRTTAFNQKRIPTNLINNFKFKQKVSYSELYKLIDNSDYIIILIDLSNKYGKEYKTIKVSGSIQLTYGFLKPALIHKEFSEFYNLDEKNSLIYNNANLYNIMRKAILLNKKEYKEIQNNLRIIENKIHLTSINNIQKVIKKIN